MRSIRFQLFRHDRLRKLLSLALESAHLNQLNKLLTIAGNKGLPLSELVQRGLAEKLASLSGADRLWTIEQFQQLEIDLEEINNSLAHAQSSLSRRLRIRLFETRI